MLVDIPASQKKQWQTTFVVLWIGCFITGLGFSMTMPFLPLFMSQLGHFSRTALNIYAGLGFSVTYLAQAIISPYWGSLADRKGRKVMCLRASGVMTFTIFFCGFAHSVWTLIGLRMLQGLFSGYINNATAFIAGETPKKNSGTVLSIMLTASVAGNLVGPLLGGVLAHFFGYRIPFFVNGALMGGTFLLTLFFTKEHFTPIPKQQMQPMRVIFNKMEDKGLLIMMFVTTLVIQASLMSIAPIISLLVKTLLHGHGSVSLISGIVAAAPGFGTILVAKKIGLKMDRIGPLKILLFGLVIESILFIPMFLTHSPWSLTVLRFILGMADAALMPAAQTILTLHAPKEAFGRIFSYNQSFQAAGGVIGPLIGSFVSSVFSYRAVFLFTASILGLNFALLWLVRYIHDRHLQVE